MLRLMGGDVTVASEVGKGSTGHPHAAVGSGAGAGEEIAGPLKLRTQRGVLSFLSTVTVFGTPVEITLSELTLEAFYPADPETLAILRLRAVAAGAGSGEE